MTCIALSIADYKYNIYENKKHECAVILGTLGAVVLDFYVTITLIAIAALGAYNAISLPMWGVVTCSVVAGIIYLGPFSMFCKWILCAPSTHECHH